MSARLAGKKAFITGAAQGLGASIAERFAAEGARVALADINLAGAEALAAKLNAAHGAETAGAHQLDVVDEAQWTQALSAADAAMGGLSVLVNNAGIGAQGNVEACDFAEWKRVMSVNVDSVFLGAKHALKYMRAHQPGAIVNISSIAGLIANENYPAYNASKAAVWLLSKSIALHCARAGLDIRSNSVHPAFIDTPILDPLRERYGKTEIEARLAAQIPPKRLGEPQDVANMVVFLASDESRFVTAAEFKVDGGVSAP
jgi:NAD(P)-dependent dehydrogenase (short-subunit alcohol dehydrogenase family)